MSFIMIFRVIRCPFPYLWHSFYNDVKICVTLYFMYEVSHQGKYCTKFVNQHNFICSQFYQLYKTTGLWNKSTNLNVSTYTKNSWCGPMTSNVFKAQHFVYCDGQVCYGITVEHRTLLNRSDVCGGIIWCNICLFIQPFWV